MSDAATTETPASSATLETLAAALGGGPLETTRFRDNVRVFLGPDRLIAALQTLRDRCGFQLLEVGGVDAIATGRDSRSITCS